MVKVFARRCENSRTAGEGLLADGLRALGLCHELPVIEREPKGKPFFPSAPNIHFSISHSGDLVFCAVSDRPVGVDVETVKPRRADLPRRVFSDGDYDRYLALGGDWPAFYTLWTEKEAAAKVTGRGLGGDPRKIKPPPGTVVTRYGGADWRCALCAGEPGGEVEWL